jgi:hypothetical protein
VVEVVDEAVVDATVVVVEMPEFTADGSVATEPPLELNAGYSIQFVSEKTPTPTELKAAIRKRSVCPAKLSSFTVVLYV